MESCVIISVETKSEVTHVDNLISVAVANVGEMIDIHDVPNTLQAMHEIIGGYIEPVRLTDSLVLWCDEEFRLKENHIEHINFLFVDSQGNTKDYICGNIMITNVNEEGDNADLMEDDIEWIERNIKIGHVDINGTMKLVKVIEM